RALDDHVIVATTPVRREAQLFEFRSTRREVREVYDDRLVGELGGGAHRIVRQRELPQRRHPELLRRRADAKQPVVPVIEHEHRVGGEGSREYELIDLDLASGTMTN